MSRTAPILCFTSVYRFNNNYLPQRIVVAFRTSINRVTSEPLFVSTSYSPFVFPLRTPVFLLFPVGLSISFFLSVAFYSSFPPSPLSFFLFLSLSLSLSLLLPSFSFSFFPSFSLSSSLSWCTGFLLSICRFSVFFQNDRLIFCLSQLFLCLSLTCLSFSPLSFHISGIGGKRNDAIQMPRNHGTKTILGLSFVRKETRVFVSRNS